MKLPIKPPYAPMEARTVDAPPRGDAWWYEPKWDGFRCLAFRDGDEVYLQSKAGKPLARYFPEVVETLRSVPARRFVLDGELVIPVAGRLSFDDLLMRVHPAESRVRKLAAEYPALFVVFDLLVDEAGRPLADEPMAERRKRLEAFSRRYLKAVKGVRLSPGTRRLSDAVRWYRKVGGDLDGIVAKRADMAYRSGERDGMQKIKHHRTADCVVGGFRYASKGKQIGSLLLGLYSPEGTLDHVGFTSSFTAAERERVTELIEPLKGGEGFSGRAPGGPSRWSTERSTEWERVDPRIVVEVAYDHFSGDRFRHGTKLVRFRPDKDPRECTMDQVAPKGRGMLRLLEGAETGSRAGGRSAARRKKSA